MCQFPPFLQQHVRNKAAILDSGLHALDLNISTALHSYSMKTKPIQISTGLPQLDSALLTVEPHLRNEKT